MKLGTTSYRGTLVPVICRGNDIINLQKVEESLDSAQRVARAHPDRLTVQDIIGAGDQGTKFLHLALRVVGESREAVLDPTAAIRVAPIPRTAKNVFCVGRNYSEHIQEDNSSRGKQTPLPEHPQFFTKPATAIIGDGGVVELDDKVTRRLDYEVELAVVIGKRGRNIDASAAYEHVFGYTIVNDITARDLQRRHDQWFKGKAIDTSCPMGPWIVTKDEIPDPHALRIELDVNGETRQDGTTADMIFKIPQLIESLSSGLTLEPGDVIATGTPSGVGYAMDPRCFLKDGDVIVCRIQGVGSLTSYVKSLAARL